MRTGRGGPGGEGRGGEDGGRFGPGKEEESERKKGRWRGGWAVVAMSMAAMALKMAAVMGADLDPEMQRNVRGKR